MKTLTEYRDMLSQKEGYKNWWDLLKVLTERRHTSHKPRSHSLVILFKSSEEEYEKYKTAEIKKVRELIYKE